MSSGRISNGSRCRTSIERAKEGILKYGLLFWSIRGIGKMLKSIWNLLIFRKKEKEKLKSPMGEIYQHWEEDWLSDEADKRKAKEDRSLHRFFPNMILHLQITAMYIPHRPKSISSDVTSLDETYGPVYGWEPEFP